MYLPADDLDKTNSVAQAKIIKTKKIFNGVILLITVAY